MRKFCAALGAAVLVLWGTVTAFAAQTPRTYPQPDFDVPCKAAILVEQTSGTVLYAKEADTQLPIASITKVMTLLLTMEAVESGQVSLTDIVPISEHSYGMGGSQIWLEPGEQFTLDELLKAICVSSANDAAVAVAEYLGGTEEAFVEKMNHKAAELGMTSTHFCNACGLDQEGHLSTARDVAAMSREILTKHPQITNYTTIWTDTLRNGQTQLVNTNKLLRNYQGINGLKTGTTGGAGVCVTASAERDGVKLIAVVLGSASGTERWNAARSLLDYGFANFTVAQPQLPAAAASGLAVTGGAEETVTLQYPELQPVLVQKGAEGSVKVGVSLPTELAAPVEAGQQLGTLTVEADGQTAGEYPVCAAQTVEKMNFPLALRQLWNALIFL